MRVAGVEEVGAEAEEEEGAAAFLDFAEEVAVEALAAVLVVDGLGSVVVPPEAAVPGALAEVPSPDGPDLPRAISAAEIEGMCI